MLNYVVSTSRRLRQRMRGELGDQFVSDCRVAYLFCAKFVPCASSWEHWHDGVCVFAPGLLRSEMIVSVSRANDKSNQLVFYVDTSGLAKTPQEAESVMVTAHFLLVSRRGRETVAKFYFRVLGGVVTMYEPSRKQKKVTTVKPRPRKLVK